MQPHSVRRDAGSNPVLGSSCPQKRHNEGNVFYVAHGTEMKHHHKLELGPRNPEYKIGPMSLMRGFSSAVVFVQVFF